MLDSLPVPSAPPIPDRFPPFREIIGKTEHFFKCFPPFMPGQGRASLASSSTRSGASSAKP